MKVVFIIASLVLSASAYAESISCEGLRPDNIKIQVEIENFENASIAYVDPIYGLVSRQGFEKNLLRERAGSSVYYVSEDSPHGRFFHFPNGTQGNSVKGVLLSQSLEMNCSIDGDLAPEIEKPAPIVCSQKDYKKSLFDGIKFGNVRDVEEALSCGANANDKNEKGCTAFLYATDLRCGDFLPQKILGDKDGFWTVGAQRPGLKNPVSPALTKVIDLMVNSGALLDARDPKNGETPLIKLVRNRGNSEIIASFLENEPNVDAQDLEGNTALMWAVTLSKISSEALSAIQELNMANSNRIIKNTSSLTAYQIAKNLGLDEKSRDSFNHEFDRRILLELQTAKQTVVITGEAGACSPLQIELKEGDSVEFHLVAKEKMYLMKAPALSLELMAMVGDNARQVITLSKHGQFTFTCGIHGASQQSKGTISVK